MTWVWDDVVRVAPILVFLLSITVVAASYLIALRDAPCQQSITLCRAFSKVAFLGEPRVDIK